MHVHGLRVSAIRVRQGGPVSLLAYTQALHDALRADRAAVAVQGTPEAGAAQKGRRMARERLAEEERRTDPEDVARLLAYLEAMRATERARLGYVAHPDELTLHVHEKAKLGEWAARDQLRAAVVAGVKL